MSFFRYVPRDAKTNYFALPLIYHIGTQKYSRDSLKKETWKPGKVQIHKCLCSPQSLQYTPWNKIITTLHAVRTWDVVWK